MILPYWLSLLVISVFFAGLERLVPWRNQSQMRKGVVTDLTYLAFNGHFLALLLVPVTGWLALKVDPVVMPVFGKNLVSAWPLWSQFLLAFFAVDLVQWGVHNLMHRVPWLWSIHRVHHSITDMDWLGSMRFHWLEIVVYKSMQYVPLMLLGFHWQVLAWLAVFSTAMGHFNHANLNVPLGPLRYLLNHPTMHIWHHDFEMHGGYGCNFGINLSLWDWLFGTAYIPPEAEQPTKIGFPGITRFPTGFLSQQGVPLTLWARLADKF